MDDIIKLNRTITKVNTIYYGDRCIWSVIYLDSISYLDSHGKDDEHDTVPNAVTDGENEGDSG